MTKVLVLGAGGIVGQHMMLSVPTDVDAYFARHHTADPIVVLSVKDGRELFRSPPLHGIELDATGDPHDTALALGFIDAVGPDVIINLAGENRVDVVEQDADRYAFLNEVFPGLVAKYCQRHGVRFIQGSTQGVFSGDEAPYRVTSMPNPLTAYGNQKMRAEVKVLDAGGYIARLTFVLGVRPFQMWGRTNPLEDILSRKLQFQVNDRWFSPLMATDAAAELWSLVDEERLPSIVHLGEPARTSRYLVACEVAWSTGLDIIPIAVPHEFFPGIAPRPFDSRWADSKCRYRTSMRDGILAAYDQWKVVNGIRPQ